MKILILTLLMALGYIMYLLKASSEHQIAIMALMDCY